MIQVWSQSGHAALWHGGERAGASATPGLGASIVLANATGVALLRVALLLTWEAGSILCWADNASHGTPPVPSEVQGMGEAQRWAV